MILNPIRGFLIIILILAFLGSGLNLPQVYAGQLMMPLMPAPGQMVALSQSYNPASIKGIVIHPDNPFKFDFLVDHGQGGLNGTEKRTEYKKLIKYFLASLTVPDRDQWVNLSPYEKNHIIEADFGQTTMGRDLLAQDYLLKQITSSLMYPESGLGKRFWDTVYERAAQEYHTTDIPVNTFNKVWIVPDEAVVYESGDTAYILKNHLKVMLEEDYLSLQKHQSQPGDMFKSELQGTCPQAGCQASKPLNMQAPQGANLSQNIIKQLILPALEKEVNEGENFAPLRQMANSMLLATWYKKALRESLLGRIYADKSRVQGINQDPQNNERIYKQYLAAYKKGVYNFIKEDKRPYSLGGNPGDQPIARKYFAGGWDPQYAKITRVVIAAHFTQEDARLAREAELKSDQIDRASIALQESVLPQDAAIQASLAQAFDVFLRGHLGKKSDAAMIQNIKEAMEAIKSMDPNTIKTLIAQTHLVPEAQTNDVIKLLEEIRTSMQADEAKILERISGLGISESDFNILVGRMKGFISAHQALMNDEKVYSNRTVIQMMSIIAAFYFTKVFLNSPEYITNFGETVAFISYLGFIFLDKTARFDLRKYSVYKIMVILTLSYSFWDVIPPSLKQGLIPYQQRIIPKHRGNEGRDTIREYKIKFDMPKPRIRDTDAAMIPTRERNRKMLRTEQNTKRLIYGAAFLGSRPLLMSAHHLFQNESLNALLSNDMFSHLTGITQASQQAFLGTVFLLGSLVGFGVDAWRIWKWEDKLNQAIIDGDLSRAGRIISRVENNVFFFGGKDVIEDKRALLFLPTISTGSDPLIPGIIFTRPSDDLGNYYISNTSFFRNSYSIGENKYLILGVGRDSGNLFDIPDKLRGLIAIRFHNGVFSVIKHVSLTGSGEANARSSPQDLKDAYTLLRSKSTDPISGIYENYTTELMLSMLKGSIEQTDILRAAFEEIFTYRSVDAAQAVPVINKIPLEAPGGIDFNSANFNVQIRRDAHGAVLPVSEQDLAQLSRISGFEPEILEIKPAGALTFLSELSYSI